jgi:hypothetical protein
MSENGAYILATNPACGADDDALGAAKDGNIETTIDVDLVSAENVTKQKSKGTPHSTHNPAFKTPSMRA